MFEQAQLERAVDLQRRSYRLLKWTAAGIDRGFLSTRATHQIATLPETASAWIEQHYDNLPEECRPPRADLSAFANLFSTYLYSSFDLLESPGQRLYSPDAHCFCPMCSWLVDRPRLKPKKLTSADKRRAVEWMHTWAEELALEIDCTADDRVLRSPDLQEALALGAYGKDLLSRLEGFSEGPATLALWRTFAWKPTGSPKKGFVLEAAAILGAQSAVLAALKSA